MNSQEKEQKNNNMNFLKLGNSIKDKNLAKDFDFVKEYEKIFIENIKRNGARETLQWLKATDFFIAPASTVFHGNFQGGLVEHCVWVYWRFCKLAEMEYGRGFVRNQAESLAIIALLHDVCKIDCYHVRMKNVKVDGAWESQPYYAFEENLPYGHGEKSVYLISKYMKLTEEEAIAINWHMGAFDARVKNNSSILSHAFEIYPLALLFHMADYGSSYFDEKRR